jgi:hypothetical protein
VHAAIWRETAEPAEAIRRMPVLLKHFYFIMFLWLLYYLSYLIISAGGWKWNQYDTSPAERRKSEDVRPRPTPGEPSR